MDGGWGLGQEDRFDVVFGVLLPEAGSGITIVAKVNAQGWNELAYLGLILDLLGMNLGICLGVILLTWVTSVMFRVSKSLLSSLLLLVYSFTDSQVDLEYFIFTLIN
jgi:hypothetical protein